MNIDSRYKIEVVVIEIIDDNGNTGDVYSNFADFRKDKPESSYKFGFVIIDSKTGFIPDNCNDWNDSVEDAFTDYYTNVEQ